MKIAIICDVLGEANNGTSLAAYNLIKSLKEKGHEVRVVCPDPLKSGEDGFYVMPTINFGIFNNYVKHNGVSLAKKDITTLEKACEGVDIVHGMLPFTCSQLAAKYCLEHHIPMTSGFHAQAENITSHFFTMNSGLVNKSVYKALWRMYYKKVDAIHFPTEFIRSLIMDKYHLSGPKPYVISNGVQTSIFNDKIESKRPTYLNGAFIIVMSGRLTKEKNQKILLKAIRKSKYKDYIQIIFAGDGPRKEALLKYGIKHLKNPPIIRSFKHEELNKVLRYADLYVHTSIIEIEAISCLEALACGLVPVIANSPRSATSKFSLRKESSFNYKSVKDLSDKIDWWIEHPEERKKASKEYAEYAKGFDFNLCMDKMEKMFLEVIKNYDPNNNKPWLKKKNEKK